MEKYIQESLAVGVIHPSSPTRAVLDFLFEKKSSLHPCINYWGLNNITLKDRYPLPLISSAFELLHGSYILSKLDLLNADHLVPIMEDSI